MNFPESEPGDIERREMGNSARKARELLDISTQQERFSKTVTLIEQRTNDSWILQLTTGLNDNPGIIDASISDINGEPKAMVEGLGAGTKGQGEATRLMQALIVSLKQRGVHELWSYSVSADALKFRKQFFGEASLHFYDPDHSEMGFLPLSAEEALETTERVSEIPGGPNYNFGICVDLNQVNESNWTAPTVTSGSIEEQFYELYPRIPNNLELESFKEGFDKSIE